jgi:hypothetical protein
VDQVEPDCGNDAQQAWAEVRDAFVDRQAWRVAMEHARYRVLNQLHGLSLELRAEPPTLLGREQILSISPMPHSPWA